MRLLSVFPSEPGTLLQAPANGGEGKLRAGFGKAHEAGPGHTPEAFHMAEDRLDTATGDADFNISCLVGTP